MQRYRIIEIFTAEEAQWQGEPLAASLVDYVHRLKIAARCLVFKGIAGCYENGEIASSRLEVLSYNMPLWIKIILPAQETDRILADLQKMVVDGIVAVQDLDVVSFRTGGMLLPRHIRVQDIMTPAPQRVSLDASLADVARLLLSSTFTGLPVVDAQDRPVGVISQTDLIYRAGLPMRLGLLAQSDQENLQAVLQSLAARQARDVMTRPPVTIHQGKPVTEAVDLMLDKQIQRLPVVDSQGKLVGNLSGVDVFHSILQEGPDWQALQKQAIAVGNLRLVADIMRRDVITAPPETPVENLIRLIDVNDLRRICVVDQDGTFLGLIVDRDLLAVFSHRHPGIWDYFVSKLPFTERGRPHHHLQQLLQEKNAAEVMHTDIVTVREDAPLGQAIRLMLEGGYKSLPVVDEHGKFLGLVSREALLRGGFAGAQAAGPTG